MKTVVFLLGIVSLLSFKSVDSTQETQYSINYNIVECNYGQCSTKAKSTGKRCKHCVSNSGDLYCWQHD